MVELWHEYLHVTCFWSHKIKPENLMLPFRGLDNWHKLLIQAEMGYSIIIPCGRIDFSFLLRQQTMVA